MTELQIECPNCQQMIIIMENEINCAIFRHGAYKKNFEQINSHENKENCDRLFAEGLIYGCGKPFRLTKKDDGYVPEICEYITSI